MTDRSKESIDAAKHAPVYDAGRINRAVEKANSDPDFVDYAAGQLAGLQFPAFKQGIIEYAKSINADKDVIAFFEILNGYMEFRDQYHVYNALQENVTSRKKRVPGERRNKAEPERAHPPAYCRREHQRP